MVAAFNKIRQAYASTYTREPIFPRRRALPTRTTDEKLNKADTLFQGEIGPASRGASQTCSHYTSIQAPVNSVFVARQISISMNNKELVHILQPFHMVIRVVNHAAH